MRHFYTLALSLCFFCISYAVIGQHQNTGKTATYLGKSHSFLKKLTQTDDGRQKADSRDLSLKVNDSLEFRARINYRDKEKKGTYVIGTLPDAENASFFITSADNASLKGHIVFREKEKAYKYYSDEEGNAYIKAVDINSILCVDYDTPAAPKKEKAENKQDQDSVIAKSSHTELNSKPDAEGVIYLDFDGQYVSGTLWNDGASIDAAPSGMSEADIRETWEIVSEDFRPFNVTVTTDSTVFHDAPQNRRIRCIFTPTNEVASANTGGIAYIDAFNWDNDTPCWIFQVNSAYGAGVTASHEAGHTFGLSHDGRTYENDDDEEYYGGHGDWAPIMGSPSYGRNMIHWSKGEYENASNTEDDIAIIASATNGIGHRADDHGDNGDSASNIVTTGTGEVVAEDNEGIIEQETDVDYFQFTTTGGNVQLDINPAENYENLNVLATLYNSTTGNTITTSDEEGNSAASINTAVDAGDYYLTIEGTGEGDPVTDGYSDYGSLGIYSISGSIPIDTVSQEPYGGDPWPIPGRVEMEDYDEGGQNFAYYDLTEENEGGEYRSDQVDILAESSGYSVTSIESDEWLEYTVDVQDSGYHRVELLVAADNEQGQLRIEMDREDVSGTIDIPNTNGNYDTVQTSFTLQEGVQVMRVYAETGGFSIDYLDFPDVTVDCNGDENGTAYIDSCGECVGGNTGASPCEQDCEGVWGGAAYTDSCGVCVGGNTGITACNVNHEEGLYVIHAVHSDLCLTPGNEITQENCTDDSLQGWQITKNGNYYELYSVDAEQYLNYSLSGGQELFLSSDPGLFRLENAGGDQFPTFHIVPSSNPEEVADVNGNNSDPGQNLTLYERTGNDNQRFTFIPFGTTNDCNGVFGGSAYLDSCDVCVGGSTGRSPCLNLADDQYLIHPVHSGLCLENTDPVTQQNCDMENSEIWTLSREGNYYRIAADMAGSEYIGYTDTTQNADIVITTDTANTLFRLEEAGGDSTAFMIPKGNLDITADVSGNNMDPGGNLILWENLEQDNQRFTFESYTVTSSEEELSTTNEVQVHPNPFKHALHVQFSGAFTYYVHGVSGQLITSGDCKDNCDIMQDAAPGLYILTIQSGDQLKKVRIEKFGK